MKRIVLLILLGIGTMAASAQIVRKDSVATIKKPTLINPNQPVKQARKLATTPLNTPATTAATGSQSQQKATGESAVSNQAADNSLYIISAARVTIKTGNDSKEYPSKIQIFLFPMPAPTYTYAYTLGQLNYTNHMVVGSSTELGLTALNKQLVPWPVYYPSGYSGTNKPSYPFTSGSHNWMLSDLQQQGFRLLIAYHPNLALDAWEIKQVTVQLEIRKADGTAHPTLNHKTIVFDISTPPLGVPTGLALVCEADKYFMPTTHYLTKDIYIN
jgi:hypothetical protein